MVDNAATPVQGEHGLLATVVWSSPFAASVLTRVDDRV